MEPVDVHRGSGPIVLGIPHAETWLPDPVRDQLTPSAAQLLDTDWHVDRLYGGLLEQATTVKANFHRYLIDANRNPDGASLYPGQQTTGLVPLTDFDGRPLWRQTPADADVSSRLEAWHRPYHQAIAAELDRVHRQYGLVILFDCHSIRSRIPFLFDGVLPDLNIGTNRGTTCAPEVESIVVEGCTRADGYTSVLNGRFRGGWTTRYHGDPSQAYHAIQMELAQSTYLVDECETFDFDFRKAERLRPVLKQILDSLQQFGLQAASVNRDEDEQGTIARHADE